MITNSAERGTTGCLSCGGTDLESEYSVVSPYFALKAFNEPPSPCQLHRCRSCDFRFYGRGLTDKEGDDYYRGYRDETYFTQHNRYEPFYTRAEHDGLTKRLGSDSRTEALTKTLRLSDPAAHFECVVDYGGGDGSLIGGLSATRKISFDRSGNPGRAGIEIIEDRDALPSGVDLVTCAQVLEHVSDPRALFDDMISLLNPGGLLYLEVPDQIWRRFTSLRLGQRVIAWLSGRPRLLLAADIYSTAFRVKLGILPPFGFVPMREHINFFSAGALRAFSQRNAMCIQSEGRTDDNSFYLIAKKLERFPQPLNREGFLRR
jgi:SAM-dependent methyltransferase